MGTPSKKIHTVRKQINNLDRRLLSYLALPLVLSVIHKQLTASCDKERRKKLDICEQLKGHSLSLFSRKVAEGDIEAEDVRGPKCLGEKPRAKEILRISIPDYI